jgi:hypothetical protein
MRNQDKNLQFCAKENRQNVNLFTDTLIYTQIFGSIQIFLDYTKYINQWNGYINIDELQNITRNLSANKIIFNLIAN